jgi:NAD(P)-dependent dehydrogenase (short-subunit alcohol dehydrogenase family)
MSATWKRFKHRSVLVTGAGSGIGKAAAIQFAREGAMVSLLARSLEPLQEVAMEIKEDGGQSLIVQADVSSAGDMKRALETIIERWGRLDVVFANAGINGVWAPLDELQPEEWDKTLAVNLKGTFLTLKYSIPELRKHGGSIVITSSVNGTRKFTTAGASAYSASKAAQVALTQQAALELAKFNIRVNAVCPGAIESRISEHTHPRHRQKASEPVEFPTGSIPLTGGKPGTPDQVAGLVLFLASDQADHISGSIVTIDGTQSLLQ